MESGFRELEHTADLALEVWAPTQEALLSQAAKAVASLMSEAALVGREEMRVCELEAVDGEDRLVRWLNEVIWWAVGEEFFVGEVEVELEGEERLRARVWGEVGGLLRQELKSVTYHGLELRREAGVWRAQVVIDV